MKKIDPQEIKGARAYFTNFDYRIVWQATNKEVLQKNVERTLKVLLLTKNDVICAASHLTSEFTYNILKTNPIILKKQMLIPALRKDKNNISDVFKNREYVNKKQLDNMIGFYNDKISKVVSWELLDNSNWFRNTFVEGIKNNESIIRKNLKGLSKQQINILINKIENVKILDRDAIVDFSKNFSINNKLILKNYRELVYHMSGARVVNCESTLPQENFIDYSLSDIKNRKIILSEYQIFWKIFIEILFETLNKPKLPIEIIDLLSFDDIYEIRRPIQDSNFISEYDKILKKSVNSITKENLKDFLYNAEELLNIRNNIAIYFNEIFNKNLKNYFRDKMKSSSIGLVKNTLNIGLGFIPFSNLISGIIGAISESRSFIFNLSHGFKNRKSIYDYENYILNKQKELTRTISKFEMNDKTIMLDMVRLLTETISNKTTI